MDKKQIFEFIERIEHENEFGFVDIGKVEWIVSSFKKSLCALEFYAKSGHVYDKESDYDEANFVYGKIARQAFKDIGNVK